MLYEELNPIRRRRLHQRIGEALEKAYDASVCDGDATGPGADSHAQDLAHHFMQAGDLPRSLAYSQRAARNATRVFALDEALKFLDQARESAEALHREDVLAHVYEQIGDVHDSRGTTQPAVDGFEQALARVSAPTARAALKARIGSVYCQVGDARGIPFLEEALAELDPGTQTNELALSLAFMGRYYHYRTEQRKAIEFLERARQLAEPLDDAATLAAIYSFLAGANQHMLAYPESDRWARMSITFGERKDFPHSIANGYEFLAENCAGRGLWKDALAYAERDREFGAKSGSLARTAWAGFATVQALHGTGELASARQVAEATLEMCGQIGETRLATWLDPMLTIVTADLGDDDAARMHAERGWARAQELDQLVLTVWALHAAGRAAMQRGDVADAMRWYEQYVPLVQETENALSRNLILGCAAEAFLHAGRVDEAARMARQAIEIGEFAASPHYLGIDCRVYGQILAAQEKPTEALQAFDRAVDLFRETGSRLELGRALCHRAALNLAHGDASAQAAARSDLVAARDSFAAMGAVHDLAIAQRELAQ